MHWPFCNSSNSPGKFSSSRDAVRHCEAPASSGVQALWNSWEHTQLTCAGRCHCCCTTILFVPMPTTVKPGVVCAPLQTSLHWCLLVCPSRATCCHPHTQSAIGTEPCHTLATTQTCWNVEGTAEHGCCTENCTLSPDTVAFQSTIEISSFRLDTEKNQLESPCFFTELGELWSLFYS